MNEYRFVSVKKNKNVQVDSAKKLRIALRNYLTYLINDMIKQN